MGGGCGMMKKDTYTMQISEDKSSLKNRQIFFLVYLSLIGGMLFNGIPHAVEWFDLYYTVAFVIQGVLCSVFCLVCGRKKDINTTVKSSMYERMNNMWGSVIAIIVSVILLVLVLIYLGYAVQSTSLLIKEAILPRTSIIYIAAIVILCTIFSADKGIRNVARVCEIFGVVVLVLLALTAVTMIFSIDVYQLLPMNVNGLAKTVSSSVFSQDAYANVCFVFPIIVIVVVNSSKPKTQHKNNNVTKPAVVAVWSAVLTMIILTTCVVGVMGVAQSKSYADSLLVAIKQTSIPLITFLQRLDIVVITAMVLGFFCACSSLVCVCHELLSQSTKLKKSTINILIIIGEVLAILLFQISMLNGAKNSVIIFAVTVVALIMLIVINLAILMSKGRKVLKYDN